MSRSVRSLGYVLLALAMLTLPAWRSDDCAPATTLLIVRHADRLGTEDALTPAGVARAQELAHVAEQAGVAAIYSSDTNRTRATAAPLGSALHLTPILYAANDAAALVRAILTDHRGKTVLVVGHSNTVPRIIAEAGGPALPDLPDDEYDGLFVLTVPGCQGVAATLVHLQYGAVSP
jgi:broad specificity phosphatase PhoE